MKSLLSILLSALAFVSNAQTVSLPYFNSFDSPTQMAEWSHYALGGTDDWEVGAPQFFGTVNSAPNAWVTTLNGNCAQSSTRCLETPDFDLSDVSTNKILAFYQKRQGSNCTYQLQYSTDGGANWEFLDHAAMPKVNWQGASGWVGNATTQQRSAIRLSFLQGNATVRFRFIFFSWADVSRGWMIDDFSIQDEYINVHPSQGDTITDITPYFTNFTLVNSFLYATPYGSVVNFRNAFYLSSDASWEPSDTYLGNVNFSTSGNLMNWVNTFPLPQGLAPGDYYVFARLDTLNNLIENDETDNIAYTVLRLTAPELTDYADNFDDTAGGLWKKVGYANDTTWLLGDPNGWHTEDPHTAPNSWFSGKDVANNSAPQSIESPFLDLTATDSNALCFWYKHSGQSYSFNDFFLNLPAPMPTVVGTPSFPNFSTTYQVPIRQPRRYGWDCYCHDISTYDNERSTKFRITASGNLIPFSLSQAAIDDIYIGAKKPDVSIENETARFTSAQSATDTLVYVLYNSGLQDLPATETAFYWSTDNVLDPSDVLLTTVSEPTVPDTSFIQRAIVITKPVLTPGTYYLLWICDADSTVTEMRENNNTGVMEIVQSNTATLPYSNDFETQTTDWHHHATLGADDWQWSAATGVQIDSAFSGEKAFFTNANGDTVSPHSRSHLYTPVFDLSELENPVLEFDLMAMFSDPNYGYSYWPFNVGNIMYSTNGGVDWEALTPRNRSFKRMFNRMEFSTIVGSDLTPTNGTEVQHAELLYGKNQPIFLNQWDYQTRMYDDNHHYVVDLAFLEGETVQFMFIYANENAPMEGMMMDNFSIREKHSDLMIPTDKKILAASGDKKIRAFFHVKNNENYMVPPTQLTVYCSTDSILDGADVLVTTKMMDSIRPFAKQLVIIDNDAPANMGQYNYLLCATDAQNVVAESNEANNVHVFDLAMDSCSNFVYPLLFDFNEIYIDGWSWAHDSNGWYHANTLRTQRVIADPVYGSNSGEWFLDPHDMNGFNLPTDAYPTYRLYSPAFDFSTLTEIGIAFDLLSIANWEEGANLSYSIDGGLTWQLLPYDLTAVNWYNNQNVEYLNEEPGWSYVETWRHVTRDISFLGGQPNVRFMFKYRGKSKFTYPGPQGFRLDNFAILALTADLLTEYNNATINATLSVPQISYPYAIENAGDVTFNTLKTGFYWSEDNSWDENDIFIGEYTEPVILPESVNPLSRLLTYPIPILQTTYYVIHKVDNNLAINETNESNNIGVTPVQFDATHVGLDEHHLISGLKRTADGYELAITGQSVTVEFLTLQGQVLFSTENVDEDGIVRIYPGTIASGAYIIRAVADGNSSVVRVFHH